MSYHAILDIEDEEPAVARQTRKAEKIFRRVVSLNVERRKKFGEPRHVKTPSLLFNPVDWKYFYDMDKSKSDRERIVRIQLAVGLVLPVDEGEERGANLLIHGFCVDVEEEDKRRIRINRLVHEISDSGSQTELEMISRGCKFEYLVKHENYERPKDRRN